MDRNVATITWQRALKIYWAQIWRSALVAFGLVIFSMLTYGFFSSLLRELIGIGELVLRGALTLALVLYAFSWGTKRALQIQYSDFQVETVPAVTMNERKALAVWWATFWRGSLISIPVNFLNNYLITGSPLPGAATPSSLLFTAYSVQMFLAVAVGVWATRIALKLDYGSWRLQLTSKVA